MDETQPWLLMHIILLVSFVDFIFKIDVLQPLLLPYLMGVNVGEAYIHFIH